MRIYGEVGEILSYSEYFGKAIVKISLSPIKDCDCVYQDIEEGKEYKTIGKPLTNKWKWYNGSRPLGEYFFNTDTIENTYESFYEIGEFDSPIKRKKGFGIIKLEDGRTIDTNKYKGYSFCNKYQEYKDGEPIGEPYFKLF